MINLGIVGSRIRTTMDDYTIIKEFVYNFLNKHKDITLISGGAKGVDTLAEEVAKEFKLPITIHLPNHSEYPKKRNGIYFERNKLIASQSDYLLALPNGNMKGGTMNTIGYFKAMGKSNNLTIK